MKQHIINGEIHYSKSDAARFLGCSVKQLKEYIAAGRLDGVQRRTNEARTYLRAKQLVQLSKELSGK